MSGGGDLSLSAADPGGSEKLIDDIKISLEDALTGIKNEEERRGLIQQFIDSNTTKNKEILKYIKEEIDASKENLKGLDNVKGVNDKLDTITKAWDEHYKKSKASIIDSIGDSLNSKLLVTATLPDDDKKSLIDEYKQDLGKKNSTLASLNSLKEAIDKDEQLKKLTSKDDANKHLNDLSQKHLQILDEELPQQKQSSGLGGEVDGNKPEENKDAGENFFELKSKTFLGQMGEAFFKLLTNMQFEFDFVMRFLSEAASKLYGMGMTVRGGLNLLGGIGGKSLGFDMTNTLKTAARCLETGKKYDGTLPLIYDLYKRDFSGAKDDFKNSIFASPFRMALQLPGGALVWNLSQAAGYGGLAAANMVPSGANNAMGFMLNMFPGTKDKARGYFESADKYNENTRFFGNKMRSVGVEMMKPPFYEIFGPAPISEGAKSSREAGYNFLATKFSEDWFGEENLARRISKGNQRGTVDNNPGIKTEPYFEQQQQRLGQIGTLLKGQSQKLTNTIIDKIKVGNYPIPQMDKFIENITREKSSPDGLNAIKIGKALEEDLKSKQSLSKTRMALDFATAIIFLPLIPIVGIFNGIKSVFSGKKAATPAPKPASTAPTAAPSPAPSPTAAPSPAPSPTTAASAAKAAIEGLVAKGINREDASRMATNMGAVTAQLSNLFSSFPTRPSIDGLSPRLSSSANPGSAPHLHTNMFKNMQASAANFFSSIRAQPAEVGIGGGVVNNNHSDRSRHNSSI